MGIDVGAYSDGFATGQAGDEWRRVLVRRTQVPSHLSLLVVAALGRRVRRNRRWWRHRFLRWPWTAGLGGNRAPFQDLGYDRLGWRPCSHAQVNGLETQA